MDLNGNVPFIGRDHSFKTSQQFLLSHTFHEDDDMKATTALLSTFALLATASIAAACTSPAAHERSFLKELPQEALERPAVALVRIDGQSILDGDEMSFLMTSVTVVEGIKGVATGSVLQIAALETSCSVEHGVDVGSTYFIAGIVQDGLFDGLWRNEGGRFDK